jgi:protein-S-isoprenylcysteine O-methyltransferase Ste14
MYLGFVLIVSGVAVLLGSLTPYAAVTVFAIFLGRVFVTHEEAKLERSFGDSWLRYKQEVRRWI